MLTNEGKYCMLSSSTPRLLVSVQPKDCEVEE